MNSVLQKIYAWMIASTWFKKYSGIIGGVAVGMWFQREYWREVNATLTAWGVDGDAWNTTLLLIAGAAGISASIGLSLVKSAKIKSDAENAAADLELPPPGTCTNLP